MKLLGIIAEYNPFHNGHLYLIQQLKKLTGATHVVVVMSGNFVQRGDIAVFDKWTRANMALLNGVDLVIEIPVSCVIQSAQNYAYYAVKLLNDIGKVDFIGFGSESGNLNEIQEIATFLLKNDRELYDLIKSNNNKGINYAKARAQAYHKYHPNFETESLKMPNNILAIEYLQALMKLNSSIAPVTIKRYKASHHSDNLNETIVSANAIRLALKHSDHNSIKQTVPDNCHNFLFQSQPVFVEDLELAITAILRKTSLNELRQILDVSEGLEQRIKKAAKSANSFSEIANIVKTKRYTHTRICRILMRAFLSIDSDSSLMEPQYLRVLGLNHKGAEILNETKKNINIPYLIKLSNDIKKLNDNAIKQLNLDVLATDLYSLAQKKAGGLDYLNSPVVIK